MSLVSPLINGLSTALGNTAGLALGIALPIAGLYLFVPVLFKFFSKLLKKNIRKLCKNNNTDYLDYFPSEGPLFNFICNISTLLIVDKLVVELKLIGIDKISFDYRKLKAKLTGEKPELNNEEKILYRLAKTNAKKLIKIAKKAQSKQKLFQYKNLETTVQLFNEIKKFTDKSININVNNEINFFITIVAVLIDKEEQTHKRTFFNRIQSLSVKNPKEKNIHLKLQELQNNIYIQTHKKFSESNVFNKERQAINILRSTKKNKTPIINSF